MCDVNYSVTREQRCGSQCAIAL